MIQKDIDRFDKYMSNFVGKVNELMDEDKRHKVSNVFIIGRGPVAILNEFDLKNGDIMGLYAFWDKGKIEYVGISRNVINRLCQHTKGTTHHSATLPIKILRVEESKKYKGMETKKFNKTILGYSQKKYLNKMSVSFVEVNDDIELYLFEVYCAVIFECKYNHFRTH